MNVEDDEPQPNQSPPHASDSPPQPPNISTNADDVHDDVSNVPNDGDPETVVAGEVAGEAGDAAANASTEVAVADVASVEGSEMHVMDDASIEDEIVVEEKGNDGTDADMESEKANEGGGVDMESEKANEGGGVDMESEKANEGGDVDVESEKANEGGDVDMESEKANEGGDVDMESEKVKEDGANLIVQEVEVQVGDDNTDEAPLTGQEEEVDGEKEEEDDEKEEEDGEKEEEGDEIEQEGEEQQHEDDEELEQEQEQEKDAEEEADVEVDGDLAKDKEAAEEMKVAEEQTASGGKRKRRNGKNSKAGGRVPSKKKTEEDVCFICFDGGDLVLCDHRGCPKAYHPSCINRDEAFFRAKGKWNCGWHLCSICEKKSPHYFCYTCTFSLCKGCIKDAVMLCARGNKGFCETCMKTVMLIEQNEEGNTTGPVDFDDKSSWEYLFKDYYVDLKEKLSLTFDELAQAKNPWKGSGKLPSKEESADELFDATNDKVSDSDSSYENVDLGRSKKRKSKRRAKSRSKRGADGASTEESSEWASKELLEFVMHMRNGDKSMLSQFDVHELLLEYIKINKLRDPRRKSQILCDARLQDLFGKPRVGHFEMLKLLESHFFLKEDSQAEDHQGSVVDTEVSHLEGDGNGDTYTKAGKDKKRKSRKKGDGRGLQSNVDDYAAIDNHNINLIYLRRNLVEDLLEDIDKFHDSAVGSFVRIRISGSGQKQDLYRLVQVVGTCKTAEPYKVGKKMTDILLEILNLNKTEIVSMDIISNQEFTEDECKRLRQSIKCGLINRMTVGDIQDKSLTLQAVRVKDWLEAEIVRLSHLRDRASEKGRKKELRECVEKLQLLKTPEERQRRLEEIPDIHVDPKMDPSYESDEGDEMEDKRQENFMRPRGSTAFGRKGREIASPRSGSISSDSWSGTRNYSHVNQELSRNLSNKGFSVKGDDFSNASEALNDAQLHQGRDRESQLSNSRERQKPRSSSWESGAKNIQPLVTTESFSNAVSEAATAPSSAGVAAPDVKINETEKMWRYQDPSGKVQGPFSMVQLRKWNNTGYFPTDLRIWKATEKQEESILLTDVLAGKFSKEPSIVEKTPPKAQNHSSSLSRMSPMAAQGLTGKTSSLAVEVPKNPGTGWGSDTGVRNESTNLPSPTPQTASSGSKEHTFENWSPTPVQMAGSVFGNSFPSGIRGLQASVAVNAQPGMATDTTQVHLQATEMAQALAASNMQNQISHNSRAEAQGWGQNMVPKQESQVWVGTPSQRVEPNNSATMPVQPTSHGLWGDASSVQNSVSSNIGNQTGSLPTLGFPGMSAPEPWSPQVAGNKANVMAPPPPNVPWGINMPANQNINWGGAIPANMNVNWMPAQGPAPGNSLPGWVAPTQGLPPVNANAGWVVPGQGPAPRSANPAWAASAGNPGMRGNEQSHNGDRFPNQGERGTRGGDSGRGGKPWNRQSPFRGGIGGRGGGSSRPSSGGQRRICIYHESGRCRNGAACIFQHN
ncbi:unnamed protein product [Vicia faba]|uniref:Zinc finger CCCH domain-containing protein 19 n=1 Tax=Vicia faba TaxID=3906 RepID=A0AAV0ZTT1_VICFA|nr:unnamed protein product [Vicia faba]